MDDPGADFPPPPATNDSEADAVPLAEYLGQSDGLLPLWYMPSPMVRGGSRWRLPVVLVIVGAFVLIEALGLCSTFGQLVPLFLIILPFFAWLEAFGFDGKERSLPYLELR